MKKKPLLFALLALAIVTSLTAGTLAVYTKSVSLAGDVTVKRFAFSATGGSESTVAAIILAPKESMTTKFSVSNFEGTGAPSEVPLNYTITVDIAETASKMVGLTATLSINGTVVASSQNGIIQYQSEAQLAAAQALTHDYVVTLTWNDGDNKLQSEQGEEANTYSKGLTITVQATQATGA